MVPAGAAAACTGAGAGAGAYAGAAGVAGVSTVLLEASTGFGRIAPLLLVAARAVATGRGGFGAAAGSAAAGAGVGSELRRPAQLRADTGARRGRARRGAEASPPCRNGARRHQQQRRDPSKTGRGFEQNCGNARDSGCTCVRTGSCSSPCTSRRRSCGHHGGLGADRPDRQLRESLVVVPLGQQQPNPPIVAGIRPAISFSEPATR